MFSTKTALGCSTVNENISGDHISLGIGKSFWVKKIFSLLGVRTWYNKLPKLVSDQFRENNFWDPKGHVCEKLKNKVFN